MPETALDLSVIVVSWNVRKLLEPCLRSITNAARGLSTEIFVVDNASQDSSVEMVRQLFPEIHLIANPRIGGLAPRITRRCESAGVNTSS
jgi:GT2 family glycosyltransferase